MPIDNPAEQFEQQYMKDEEKSSVGLAVFTGKLTFPKAAMPLEIFQKIYDRFTGVTVEERLKAMWHMLVMETEHLERTKTGPEQVEEAIQIVMRRDAEQFNDKKRERYVKLIGKAMREEQIEEIVSFVGIIEELNEQDLMILKVVNKIMNKPGDWKPQPNPGIGEIMKLHPNVFTQRSQELTVQIAMALGQPTEKNTYNREIGYSICNRLQAFGLLHEIDQTRELPLTNYCFRLAVQGIRLLKLLDEEVPNYDLYVKF